MLFTGDPGANGTDESFAHITARPAPLAPPLVVVPGNNDRRAPLRAAFAGNPRLPVGEGPLHPVIDASPVRPIGLDTLEEAESGDGRIDAEGCAWLDARLAEAPDRPTVVVMHHPAFATGIGHMDASACGGAEAPAAVIAGHPQVERVVCGPVHRPVTLRWTCARAACLTPPDMAPTARSRAFTEISHMCQSGVTHDKYSTTGMCAARKAAPTIVMLSGEHKTCSAPPPLR